MLQLTYHRHFTHALIFIPLGGFIAALLCWPVLRRYLPFFYLLGFATAGYAVHGVLDAATNYGTHLFWPFTNHRESWSIISVIDILFTVPVLLCLIVTVITLKQRVIIIGLCYGCCYLVLGVVQQNRAIDAVTTLAAERGHQIERMEIKPSLGNNLLWRVQYEYKKRYYIDAVHIPWSGANISYVKGGNIPALNIEENTKTRCQQSHTTKRY